MASDIINNSYAIGIVGKNLILQTAGRVYVKKQDKYYELDFGGKNISRSGEETPQLPDIIIANSEEDILNMPYPGDGKIIIGRDGSFYITIDGQLVKWEPDCNCGGGGELDGDTIINGQLVVNYPDGSPIIINGDPNVPPFIINSREIVYNLNAEFLNGFSSDEFARKVANEIITGTWTFGDIILNGSIGDGWTVLDIANSTLDIDYINVRKGINWPEGMDPTEGSDIEYKIFGTNEETWVGKEFFFDDFVETTLSSIPSPSTTSDEFSGGYYEGIVKIRTQEYELEEPEFEIDLSKYVVKDSVLKSSRATYKVMNFDSEGPTLYLKALDEGFEEEKKLVVTGHVTSDPKKKGGIHMNSIVGNPPYIDIVNTYQYNYNNASLVDGKVTIDSTLLNNNNIVARFGNLSGLSKVISPFTGYEGNGVYLKGNYLAYGSNNTAATGPMVNRIQNICGSGGSGYVGPANVTISNAKITAGQSNVTNNDSSLLLNPEGSGFLAGGALAWYGNRQGTTTQPYGYLRMTNGVISNSSIGFDLDQYTSLTAASRIRFDANGQTGQITPQFTWNTSGVTFKSNNGNYQFNPDGSWKMGKFQWGANGDGVATRTQYGVVKIGDGLDIDSNGNLIISGGGSVDPSQLPIATTTRLGAIKVGNGLSITSDGTLSATTTSAEYTQVVLDVTWIPTTSSTTVRITPIISGGFSTFSSTVVREDHGEWHSLVTLRANGRAIEPAATTVTLYYGAYPSNIPRVGTESIGSSTRINIITNNAADPAYFRVIGFVRGIP